MQHGTIEIASGESTKTIRLTRAHLEEDTGRSVHTGNYSLVDLNRAGVPLMRALADEAEFRAQGEGTTVRLVLRERRAMKL